MDLFHGLKDILKVMLEESKDDSADVETLIGTVARKYAVHAELLSRDEPVDSTGLT